MHFDATVMFFGAKVQTLLRFLSQNNRDGNEETMLRKPS